MPRNIKTEVFKKVVRKEGILYSNDANIKTHKTGINAMESGIAVLTK